jgi:hypothetical protein
MVPVVSELEIVIDGHVRPEGVEVDTVRVTAPVKPFIRLTVMVDVPELPARIVEGATGPAETWKLGGGEFQMFVLVITTRKEPCALSDPAVKVAVEAASTIIPEAWSHTSPEEIEEETPSAVWVKLRKFTILAT